MLISPATIQVSDEPWIPRVISHDITGRDDRFCHEVRNHDRRCVISGLINPQGHIQAGIWCEFRAAHIFPLGHDIAGEILAGPYGQERFNLEITTRLRGLETL